MKKIKSILISNCGEMVIEIAVLVFVAMLILALIVETLPVFVVKSDLNTMANEVMRVAEVTGRVGSATTDEYNRLKANTGLASTMTWTQSGKIQLNHTIELTLSHTYDLAIFELGTFPIPLTAKAQGRSEVYWK